MTIAAENDDIATRLEEAAQLLRDQDANIYRVRAYQHAAATVRAFASSSDRSTDPS